MSASDEITRFFVRGAPIGKARARVTRHHAYTPQKTVDMERRIAWEAVKAMAGKPPREGPLWVSIVALYDYPASWSSKRRKATKWKTSKPDRDNIEKLVCDAANKICWLDDAQVASWCGAKRYVRDDEEAGVHVEIGALSDEL